MKRVLARVAPVAMKKHDMLALGARVERMVVSTFTDRFLELLNHSLLCI